MKKVILYLSVVIVSAMLMTSFNLVSDQKDEQPPNDVIIGNQIWMTDNLNVITFRNGDTIPEVKTDEEWEKAGREKKPAWCHYENDPVHGKKYGKLYNWYAVNDPRELAPEGWKIPTDKDWRNLINNLGGEDLAKTKLNSQKGWLYQTDNGTNKSGFTALPGGFRFRSGSFGWVTIAGGWWSTSADNSHFAWSFNISTAILLRSDNKSFGYSVRCLMD